MWRSLSLKKLPSKKLGGLEGRASDKVDCRRIYCPRNLIFGKVVCPKNLLFKTVGSSENLLFVVWELGDSWKLVRQKRPLSRSSAVGKFVRLGKFCSPALPVRKLQKPWPTQSWLFKKSSPPLEKSSARVQCPGT